MDNNQTVSKINKSRYNLKKYLDKEWQTSTIIDYSDNEIDKLYRLNKPSNTNINFGSASCCNFTLFHKKINNHRLHVIYYNFPDIGKPSIKVTKTCSDKLENLYKENIINPEDSLIVILYNTVPENLQKSIENMYLNGQEELNNNGLSDEIKQINDNLDDKFTNYHFRNIHIYSLDEIAIDITQHVRVPHHECIREQSKINKILEECNSRSDQLPIISRNDAMAKRLRISPGDICKITRVTESAGEIIYYRICK